MQIDWITVAAQIVNFLILIWLLQHFLYGPITGAMDRREKRIADRLHEAAQKTHDAEAEARKFEEMQDKLASHRDQLLADARDRAEEERKTLEDAAREDIGQRRKEWLAHLTDQQETFLRDVRRQTAERFLSLGRRALDELGNARLESQIAGVFAGRLKALEADTREKLVKAARDAGNAVIVKSGIDLSPDDRRHLTKAIHDHIAADVEIDYRQDAGISCGIELRAGSQAVSWSIDGYLDSLEEELAEEIGKLARRAERQAAQ